VTAAGLAGTLVLLAGCTTNGTSDNTAPGPTGAAAPPPPVGSIAHPRPVQCVEGTTGAAQPSGSPSAPSSTRSGTPSATRSGKVPGTSSRTPPGAGHDPKEDVAVGSLIWHGLGAFAAGRQQDHGIHNSDGWHYRDDSEIRDAQIVTVTVGPEQRARAGLQYGLGSGMSPAPAVTFHGCPGTSTVFIGAFFVSGDGRACVPLDVRVGDAPPRRVTVSFFAGHCPA
jgi:hypothetical protein